MLRFITCLVVVLAVMAVAMPASAVFITGVTGTVGSSYGEGYPASNLTDGSGMTPGDPVLYPGVPVVKTSTTDNNENGGGMWESLGDPAPADKWVKFDFAAPTALNEMVIWNYNQNWPGDASKEWESGLKDVLIEYSTGTDTSGVGNTLFQGQLNCATGQPGQGYTDALPVPGGPVANVAAVKITYTSNWDDPLNPDPNVASFYGLSEVRFDDGTVPEPGTIVLAASALIGLLAYAWRKRK